jgi:hypothetical protein
MAEVRGFNRWSANHVDHPGTLCQRNAAKAGTDCRSPHKGNRRNDLAGLTHEEPTLSTRPHRSAAGGALAQCHQQQINRDRNPDLSFHCIAAGAEGT